jgi:hypothetical protein
MSFKTTTPVLNVDQTKLFLKQIDLACRLLDVKILKEVIERFGLQNLEDIPEFFQDAPEKFEFQKEEKSVQIKEVLPFSSRCIACVYGKTVMGYIIRFSVEGPGNSRINYQRYFAMNYLIVEDRLTDFGWCHSFLNPEEMEVLKS